MYKLDLHTHSIGSPDGGLRLEDYQQALTSGRLDYVAITDHETIETAQSFCKQLGDLANQIIVGEEIKTTDGEIIGLYLNEAIPSGLTPRQAVAAIKSQNGIVYIPHPFETVRSGISKVALKEIIDDVDIIEVHNGRAVFGSRGDLAKIWASKYDKAGAASSDAHGARGWFKTYSSVNEAPNRDNMVEILMTAELQIGMVGLGILYPKINRLKRKFRRGNI
ncbi:MAG: PHP domain-containing protein [Candidatus Saccharimonadales bacterium]